MVDLINMKRALLTLLILVTILLTACGSQEIYLCSDGTFGGDAKITSNKVVFVCPDGKYSKDYASCAFPNQYSISQKDAETKALSFTNGHMRANGWDSTLVNVNLVDGNWLAQIVVSKYDETSFETVIKVDGESGFASCDSVCDYLSN